MACIERAALHAGERFERRVASRIPLCTAQSCSRPAQALVRGRGDKVSMRDRAWMHFARDQACDMRHVDEKVDTTESAISRMRAKWIVRE